MSPLANQIYKQLLRMLRRNRFSITYGELAHAISSRTPTHHRSPKLHAALGEITTACQTKRLPCIPAIVWRNDTRRPGDAYYRYAHPRVLSDAGRIAAWQREHELVVRASRDFPDSL